MRTIYSQECALCDDIKMMIVQTQSEDSQVRTTTVFDGYMEQSSDQQVVDVFCPECGIKFIHPSWLDGAT